MQIKQIINYFLIIKIIFIQRNLVMTRKIKMELYSQIRTQTSK